MSTACDCCKLSTFSRASCASFSLDFAISYALLTSSRAASSCSLVILCTVARSCPDESPTLSRETFPLASANARSSRVRESSALSFDSTSSAVSLTFANSAESLASASALSRNRSSWSFFVITSSLSLLRDSSSSLSSAILAVADLRTVSSSTRNAAAALSAAAARSCSASHFSLKCVAIFLADAAASRVDFRSACSLSARSVAFLAVICASSLNLTALCRIFAESSLNRDAFFSWALTSSCFATSSAKLCCISRSSSSFSLSSSRSAKISPAEVASPNATPIAASSSTDVMPHHPPALGGTSERVVV